MEIAKEIRNVMLSKYNLEVENPDSDILILYNHYKKFIQMNEEDLVDFTVNKLVLNHDLGLPL